MRLSMMLIAAANLAFVSQVQAANTSNALSEVEHIAVALSIFATAAFCLWSLRKIKRALNTPLPNTFSNKSSAAKITKPSLRAV
ncbi:MULTISPECIES: hypothetical protein [unclassified Agarivorans]|uniref:hypothetical protein n=1 Tax=unclassified Agarivorans TaxID=2636026 RepID=UPI0026E44BAD|nr:MULTISPECIES: hypothetical protein [unclassified Agarivorans]MDO6685320.1 hypothetical protein [Agarivorans sp. 3_MG-2023]MDO6715508.1 hypothetical protein [Agarivorans sp. 2_MG-2023]